MSARFEVKPNSAIKASQPGARLNAALIVAYAAVMVIAALQVPLRVPEILQIAYGLPFHWPIFLSWTSRTPDVAPLSFFVQLPFIIFLGIGRLAARIPSLIFAIGSCYFFLRVARRISPRRAHWALLVFMFLPVHLFFAMQGRPEEQALFLLLFATDSFFRLVEDPTTARSILYGALITLAIYTQPYSYLPAVGYLLFLFRFANSAQYRRAMWFALPATIAPALLYIPYFAWAHPQVSPNWLLQATPADGFGPLPLQLLQALTPEQWFGFVLSPVLFVLGLIAVWASFSPANFASKQRVVLFCLFGGVICTLTVCLSIDALASTPFLPDQILWITPGLAVLFGAFLEWFTRKTKRFWFAVPALVLVLALSVAADAQFLANPDEDMQDETIAVRSELAKQSCVVFVSERLSKFMFLLFDPNLEASECQNFFAKRIIMASHPYVRPDQQRDAESFFHGLNFKETKRTPFGKGQIVVMTLNQ